MQLGGRINDKKKTGRPTSWTPAWKNQLKWLTNNRKGVSQRRLGWKFGTSHVTIWRQISIMNISGNKREKTPKYREKQAEKAKNLCKKLCNLLYRSSCCLVLDDEKYFTYDGSNMQKNGNDYTNLNVQMKKRGKRKREISGQSNGLGSHFQSWYIQAIISSIKVRGIQKFI